MCVPFCVSCAGVTPCGLMGNEVRKCSTSKCSSSVENLGLVKLLKLIINPQEGSFSLKEPY